MREQHGRAILHCPISSFFGMECVRSLFDLAKDVAELGLGDFQEIRLQRFPSLLAVRENPGVVSARFMAKKDFTHLSGSTFSRKRSLFCGDRKICGENSTLKAS